MTNLTQFNDFALNTEETTNVNGGWGCRTRRTRRTRRRRSYSNCYSYSSYSYNNCYSSNDCSYSYNNCEPKEEVAVEVAPVVEAPVVEAPVAAPINRGIAAA